MFWRSLFPEVDFFYFSSLGSKAQGSIFGRIRKSFFFKGELWRGGGDLGKAGFTFRKYKKKIILRKYKRNVPLRICKNFFDIIARKFHFTKYKEFFGVRFFLFSWGGLSLEGAPGSSYLYYWCGITSLFQGRLNVS